MRFVITIDTPAHLDQPRIPMAQTLREAADVVETMTTISDGVLTDRLTGVTKANWAVHDHAYRARSPQQR